MPWNCSSNAPHARAPRAARKRRERLARSPRTPGILRERPRVPTGPKSIARRGEELEFTFRAKYYHGNASCGTPGVSSQLLESPVPAAPPAALLALLAVTRSPAEEMWAGKHARALPVNQQLTERTVCQQRASGDACQQSPGSESVQSAQSSKGPKC